MIYKVIVILLFAFMLGGCTTQPLVPIAGLTVVNVNDSAEWNVANQLVEQGGGNSHRILSAQGQSGTILELAAGGQGNMEYSVETQADIAAFAQVRLQFLSTQGQGSIAVSALDHQGNIIGQNGVVFTGILPQTNAQSFWQDVRYKTNYQGDWIEDTYSCAQLLDRLPPDSVARAEKYRLTVNVSQGQHVLITKFGMGVDQSKAVRFIPSTLALTAVQGELLSIEADVQNVSKQGIDHAVVKLIEPYGYGLVADSQIAETIDLLLPGEKRHIKWQVQAKRASAVNLNKPWNIQFSVNDQ